jgi:pSer/pThr/pTyr-binding forkhead associated (FHA) protein
MPFWIRNKDYRYPLKIGMNIVGRDRESNIQIKDPHISRRHISIDVLPDGSMTLMDLGSSNGLLINGKKVANAVLNPGDTFTVGITTFTIEETSPL